MPETAPITSIKIISIIKVAPKFVCPKNSANNKYVTKVKIKPISAPPISPALFFKQKVHAKNTERIFINWLTALITPLFRYATLIIKAKIKILISETIIANSAPFNTLAKKFWLLSIKKPPHTSSKLYEGVKNYILFLLIIQLFLVLFLLLLQPFLVL